MLHDTSVAIRASNTRSISQYRYILVLENINAGINTGIQQLPILTVMAATI